MNTNNSPFGGLNDPPMTHKNYHANDYSGLGSDDNFNSNPFGTNNYNSEASTVAWSEADNKTLPWNSKKQQAPSQLEQKEKELQQKERELAQREAALRTSRTSTSVNSRGKQSNWPRFKPILYHNINDEIPMGAARAVVARSYFYWKLLFIAYLMNLVATIAMMASNEPGYGGIGGLLLAILYFVLFPPIAFYSIHFMLYKAVRDDSSFRFLIYFFNYGIQILFYVFLGIGIFSGGGGGLIGMIAMFNGNHITAGILSAICVGIMAFLTIAGVYQFQRVLSYYRGNGHSVEKARNEAVTAVAKSETGRNMAKEAIVRSV